MDPRELARFDEHIALAKLEVARAQIRVQELEYEKTKYVEQWITEDIKRQQSQPVKA